MSGRQSPSWGWHRLSSDWARRIVAESRVRPGDLVVEVGAGDGALTDPLLRTGARVIALELHPARANVLRDRLVGQNATVLTMDFRDFHWPSRPIRVVANPPFGVLGDLLGALVQHRHLIAADLVLPRSVVARYADGSRHLSRRMRADRGLNVPRSAFRPRPPIDCGVLQLRRIRV